MENSDNVPMKEAGMGFLNVVPLEIWLSESLHIESTHCQTGAGTGKAVQSANAMEL